MTRSFGVSLTCARTNGWSNNWDADNLRRHHVHYDVTVMAWMWLLWWSLQWRHNGPDGVSNHHHRACLLNCLFERRSKKTSKLRVTGLCAGNSQVTGEFPAQRASNAENVSIWWPSPTITVRQLHCLLLIFKSQNSTTHCAISSAKLNHHQISWTELRYQKWISYLQIITGSCNAGNPDFPGYVLIIKCL